MIKNARLAKRTYRLKVKTGFVNTSGVRSVGSHDETRSRESHPVGESHYLSKAGLTYGSGGRVYFLGALNLERHTYIEDPQSCAYHVCELQY